MKPSTAQEMAPRESSDPVVHVPKTDIKTDHKVISYGEQHTYENDKERRLYHFRHQRADLKVSEGVIPIGFYSKMWLEEGHPIFLETRAGGINDDEDVPTFVGPEYQVTWTKEKIVVPPGSEASSGWCNNLDELWISVLSYFERKNLLAEETLDYLDADPYVLFGLDCEVTQQSIKKLEKFPALLCASVKPSAKEWADFMRIREENEQWLVEAMADTELPKPWTCYKGTGSIVCFMRSDTGQVTWKHPFYDYFRQLRDFCRQATREEVLQVRVTRMFWNYEASRIETDGYQEPLIAPDTVEKLGRIFGFDVGLDGCIVRSIKSQLKVFAKTYRANQDIDINDVISCAEMLQRDVDKHQEMKDLWSGDGVGDNVFDLQEISNGRIPCVNCETTALAFCLECKDYLCLECYDLLHQKGGRRMHAPFRLVACTLCVSMPAKLHCTFTDKSLCHECYAMKHIRTLPPDGKENEPRRIDYRTQYIRYATFAKERIDRQKKQGLPASLEEDVDNDMGSVLSSDWHPFYDSRGVKFYHNFLTGERMRQSPRRVPITSDPGAPPELMKTTKDKEQKPLEDAGYSKSRPPKPQHGKENAPLSLNGFDSLVTGQRAVDKAAAEPDSRALRAPHRVHMPNEVPQV